MKANRIAKVFPDFVGAVTNGSGTIDWWKGELDTWHGKIPYDGIWIDMSEVSSFCVGSCGSNNLTLNPVHPPFVLPGAPGNPTTDYPEGFNRTNSTEAASASSAAASVSATKPPKPSSTSVSYLRTTPTPGVRNVNYPPYVINHVLGDLAKHAVSPNATHHGGTQEYDFHNLFGHQILNATYQGLLGVFPGKRPFIIGRSTFAGSGKWAGHWGGDNNSLWANMYWSIAQALSFSIFGIPMFGVDACGFSGNTDMELCARWMQVAAFFPFYRNHNNLGSIPQEPYRWAAVADASRTAMTIRYQLLPYMYTLFAQAHATGSTVSRALAWEFPDEPWLAAADRQFMLGGAILITPCLVQGADTTDAVFPGAGETVWYDWYNQSAATGAAPGVNMSIPAPLGHIPVFIRGGYALPLQEAKLTVRESRTTPWSVLVALDAAGAANGTLYLDDGESLEGQETWVQLSASGASLKAMPSGDFVDSNPLANVTVMGVARAPSAVRLNGQAVTSGWVYEEGSKLLKITGLEPLTSSGAWCTGWTMTWS
jgi:alpha-glucosidase